MTVSLVITEQNDRLFTGNLTYRLNGAEIVEGLAGAIGLDNKTLYIAEFDQGYDMGTIISDDEIELIYLADGEIGLFHRMAYFLRPLISLTYLPEIAASSFVVSLGSTIAGQ